MATCDVDSEDELSQDCNRTSSHGSDNDHEMDQEPTEPAELTTDAGQKRKRAISDASNREIQKGHGFQDSAQSAKVFCVSPRAYQNMRHVNVG